VITANWPKHIRITAIVFSLLILSIGCGTDSDPGDPVYAGSNTYEELRDGQTVIVFELTITDDDGNPYAKALLATGKTFTPVSSTLITVPAIGGIIQVVVEANVPGEYKVGIDGFTDLSGVSALPAPEDTNLNGKILVVHDYAP
jgi:hypothetical protein